MAWTFFLDSPQKNRPVIERERETTGNDKNTWALVQEMEDTKAFLDHVTPWQKKLITHTHTHTKGTRDRRL